MRRKGDATVNRRKFLGILGCLASGLWFSAGAPTVYDSTKRPNIIFLVADDQRDNTFGIMGHDWLKTPNMDKLIKNGVHFSNTYIAEPTCSPSRVALFTGTHERVNGVGFTSSFKLNEEQWAKTYPALLKRNGYYTGFIGKFGVEYYTFMGQAAKMFDFWRGHDGWARFFPKTATNCTSCTSYKDSREDIITPIMGESIIRFFDNAPTNKPFCLSVSFSVPHGSQVSSMWTTWDEPASMNPQLKGHPIYGSLYRDLDIKIPEETATDPYKHIHQKIMDQSKGRKKLYYYDYDRKLCREHHIRYYQQITGLDKVVGHMVEALTKKGLDGNTVIIFSSDNGLLMGEYGMGGKGLLYDLASKVPCFIYDPRLPDEQRGRTVDALVSSLDITSTILDYAGIAQPVEMEGQSLLPLMRGDKVKWREVLFLENLYTGRDTPFQEGIRKGKWKYIRMYDGVNGYSEKHIDFEGRKPDFEQLFDLDTDPKEKNNLIKAYESNDVLSDLRTVCRQKSSNLNSRRAGYKKTHEVTGR
jgi:arylsulfatase A-like enzyme